MNNGINLAWMYPDILNLHGERGNAQCFKMVAEQLGIELNIDRIDDVDAKIDFSKYDILLFNAGELKVIPTILNSLNSQIDSLNKYIEDKKTIIVTGTTGALLSNTVTRYNDEKFSGLGIFNMDVTERNTVIGDDIYFLLDDGLEIYGSQIQMIDITLKDDDKPLGDVKYGYGNNGKSNQEGAIKDNIIFTNCLGPVFVKNPWFAEKILRDICSKKDIKINENVKTNFELEKKSLESCKEFMNKKLQEK